MIGNTDSTPYSAYQPSQAVVGLTRVAKDIYEEGIEVLHRTWTELNNRSVIEDENRGQMMFNAFVDTTSESVEDAWKWRGTRSMARNKGLAMHANLTAAYLMPLFTAQNEDDETDQDFSEVMRDIVEWMCLPTNSNYQSSFLQVVFGMLTNPITYMGAEYCEVFQKIKEKSSKGKYTTKEILDEVLSGFHAPIYSSSQVLTPNAYERNIQKQKAIIKRRFVEKSELEAKYGDHENWQFVDSGIRSVYNEDDGYFHDVKDDEHQSLVAEETYLNRRDDTEVCFINGVYFGETNTENNPIKHRDNRNAPKYNVVPFGYYHIGEHFIFYKSMMNAVGWDNNLYDAMSELLMNRSILEVEFPVAITGKDKFDGSMVFPNSVVAFADKETKITPLLPSSNLGAGYQALQATEKSITEGTVNETISGQLPPASQKAYTVAQAQTNAKKLISGVAKSLGESIIQLGDLMKDIAINNITAPQVVEIVGDGMKLKYRSFILENKSVGGKMMNKNIRFDESLIGAEMSKEEQQTEAYKLLEETDYPEEKESIRRVNPERFAKFRYLTRIDIEEMFTKNAEYWQPVLLNLKTTLAQDPFIDQEWMTRKLLHAYFQSEGEKGIKKQSEQPIPSPMGMDQFGQPNQAKALSSASPNTGGYPVQ